MKLLEWEELPERLKQKEVYPYYQYLKKKKKSLKWKRIFDIILAIFLIVILTPLMLILAVCIKIDSKGPAIYKQIRVTQYGRKFHILKFRSMVVNADKLGTSVTTDNDIRITTVGLILRKYRLDELPQLFNVLNGDMTFVGTRPEVPEYVNKYTNEMLATLLLPAGITSKASIMFKDEARLLEQAQDVDMLYQNKIIPEKMNYNLEALKNYSLSQDFKTIISTVISVLR